MNQKIILRSTLILLMVSSILLLAGSVLAVDGVIEINQARALAGEVTRGDEPGFPISIKESGSFILTGKLSAPDGTVAILVESPDVQLDLNGFTITASGSGGRPISGLVADVTLLNGTLTGGEGPVLGNGAKVTNITVSNNNQGIDLGNNSIIIGSRLVSTAVGIEVGSGSLVADNVVLGTDSGTGIEAAVGSTVRGNTVRGSDVGIQVNCPSNLIGNTVTGSRIQNFLFGSGCNSSDNVELP